MTLQNHGFTWADRGAPWWVKLRRANIHIREAAIAIGAFCRDTEPWRVEEEQDDQPNVIAYRLRIDHQAPSDLQATVGDAIHNLRSALDAAAFGLAEQHLGTLTSDQEMATYFPICKDQQAFQKFLKSKNRGIKIADLYGSKEIAGFESVQPFSIAAEAEALDVQWPSTRQDDLNSDAGHRLDVLWNVDKHRRLPKLDWLYTGMACFEEPGACRKVTPNRSLAVDGQVLARHHFHSAEDVHPVAHAWGVELTLADDPFKFSGPLIPGLQNWHQYVGNWMLPRMFITAQSGGPPPMGIAGGWPHS